MHAKHVCQLRLRAAVIIIMSLVAGKGFQEAGAWAQLPSCKPAGLSLHLQQDLRRQALPTIYVLSDVGATATTAALLRHSMACCSARLSKVVPDK
jgi:hypothetical protein